MTASQQLARSAVEAARSVVARLPAPGSPGGSADDLSLAWASAESALRALSGQDALVGQALVHDLRHRDRLSLGEAHALVDFQAAAERARHPDYVPGDADVAAARDGFDRLVQAVERDGPPGPPPVAPPPRPPPPGASVDYSPMPGPSSSPGRRNVLGLALMVVALLAVVGAGAYYALKAPRVPGDLRRGRAAYAAGDRLTARNAFSTLAGASPRLAEPHIYLGRMAREDGDMPTANAELRRAVELEPGNALAHRELAAYLLANNQLELARAFYERAIRLAPDDRNALGFMGCTLVRLGRTDLGPRFLQRAGPGSWQACARLAAPAPTPPQ